MKYNWQEIIDGLKQAVDSGDIPAVETAWNVWQNTPGEECPIQLYVNEDVESLLDRADNILEEKWSDQWGGSLIARKRCYHGTL